MVAAGNRRVTLHGILAHTVAEAQRHAGHADILRELVDGASGHGPAGTLLPTDDATWWRDRFDRLERAAAAGPQATSVRMSDKGAGCHPYGVDSGR